MMKIGIVHPMAFPETLKGEGPILETVKKIAMDDFFTAIEISWIKDPKVKEAVRKVLEQSGLTVVYAGQPPLLLQKLDINSLDEAARKKAVEVTKQSVDDAYYFGARILAILSGPDYPNDRDRAKEQLIKSLVEVAEYAKEKAKDYELLVSLEVFDREYDKKRLIGPHKEAAELIAKVRDKVDNVGLTIDLSHFPLLGETPEEAVESTKDYIIHAHLGNCIMGDYPGRGDTHPRFGVPGGQNDVEAVARYLRALKRVGYFEKMPFGSILSFEVKPMKGEESDLIIANAKRILRLAMEVL